MNGLLSGPLGGPPVTVAAAVVLIALAYLAAGLVSDVARRLRQRATAQRQADADPEDMPLSAVLLCPDCVTTEHGITHCTRHDIRFTAEVEALYRGGGES